MMRATGSRGQPPRRKGGDRIDFACVDQRPALRNQRGVIEAERMADQQARIEFGRIEAASRKLAPARGAPRDVIRDRPWSRAPSAASSSA